VRKPNRIGGLLNCGRRSRFGLQIHALLLSADPALPLRGESLYLSLSILDRLGRPWVALIFGGPFFLMPLLGLSRSPCFWDPFLPDLVVFSSAMKVMCFRSSPSDNNDLLIIIQPSQSDDIEWRYYFYHKKTKAQGFRG
jgi:hypothetical protein